MCRCLNSTGGKKMELSFDRLIWGKYTEATLVKGTKWIYFSLPKCANTSIRYAINEHNGIKQKKFSDIHNINPYRLRERKLRKLLDKGYRLFVFTRNEEDRLKSSYRDFIQGKGDRDKTYPIGISKTVSFEGFKWIVNNTPNKKRDIHLRNLKYIMKDAKIYDDVAFFGFHITIERDWKWINHLMGLNLELKHLHKTK